MPTIKTAFLTAAVSCVLAASVAQANQHESAADEVYDIAPITCKEVMILSGDDRDAVISFLHGYLLGESKQTQANLTKLGRATDDFMSNCLDAPTAKALETMRKAIAAQS